MSSVVRKLCVVAPNDLQRVQQLAERTGDGTGNDVDRDSVISRREHAVDMAVADINKPADVRAKVVDQSVQEYLKARKDLDQRKPTPPAQPAIAAKDADDIVEESVPGEDLEKVETPATKLLGQLAQHKPPLIRWTQSGQLLDEFGQEVMEASATALAEFAMQSRRRSLPPGWMLFANAMVRAGIPLSDIKNMNMRRAMEQIARQDKAEKSFKKRSRTYSQKRYGDKVASSRIHSTNPY
jgi:hypothetical protein